MREMNENINQLNKIIYMRRLLSLLSKENILDMI